MGVVSCYILLCCNFFNNNSQILDQNEKMVLFKDLENENDKDTKHTTNDKLSQNEHA